MHVAAGGVFRLPDTDRILRNRIERPEQLAGLRIIGLHEAADAVFAAVGANQHLVLDDGRRHRLAVSGFRIRDVALPGYFAGLGLQGHQLGIKRGDVDHVAENLDAAIVGTAAVGRDRSHLVIIVPELHAGLGVERVDMAERRRHIHHAIDDDRRSLQQFLDVGLEDPCDVQILDVVAVDLLGRIKAGLGIVAVGQQKIAGARVGLVELILSDRRNGGVAGRRLGVLLDFLRAGERCQKTCNAKQCSAFKGIFTHGATPNCYGRHLSDFPSMLVVLIFRTVTI